MLVILPDVWGVSSVVYVFLLGGCYKKTQISANRNRTCIKIGL
jgi:hypothetical protein